MKWWDLMKALEMEWYDKTNTLLRLLYDAAENKLDYEAFQNAVKNNDLRNITWHINLRGLYETVVEQHKTTVATAESILTKGGVKDLITYVHAELAKDGPVETDALYFMTGYYLHSTRKSLTGEEFLTTIKELNLQVEGCST